MFAIACLRLCMQSGKTQIKKLFLKSFEDGGSEPWGKAVLSHTGVNLKLTLVLFAALVGRFLGGYEMIQAISSVLDKQPYLRTCYY